MKIPKVYDPKKVEDRIYNLWLRSGFFNPDKLPKRHQKSYTILIPPPNITGELHMGHALNATVQDILIRQKRLQGRKTLWLPGTDHAGIATQVRIEKELKKEGKTRFDLGQEKFRERIWQWKTKYGNIILDQLKKLGCSCDWSRTRFTMDREYSKAVKTAFLHYYQKGWIYQGERPVNFCPRCQTSLSDLEIEYKEEKGKLWYIKYKLKTQNSKLKTNFIVVATTRPETMLGDTAVAVNPKDKRYKNLIGKKAILPLVNREIPIISDRLVDPKFGTGAVKVTPGHDLKDYEISLRHNLAMIKVIDEKAKMTGDIPSIYRGLETIEARKKIIEDLEKFGLLEKIQDYKISIPKCYRCLTTIEVIPSQQWFLKMKDLAEMAEKEVKSGRIKFHPKRFEKILFDWLKNIKDWCISRQIWWGHEIPIERPNPKNVLDTWFSSALWPIATLGWPEKTKDLEKFYPTDVLSTARDIINLWVARMIFSGIEFMGSLPFKDVFIHPTVLTKEGKRMSRSLGTGIDPMRLIEKYGADATRFGIIWQVRGGQDIRFTEDNIVMGRKFCNKIWNAARFVMLQTAKSKVKSQKSKVNLKTKNLTQADKRILKALAKTIKSVNRNLENFRFGKAAETLYDFFWHDFCDKYIEEFKIQNPKSKSQKVLLYVLLTSLKLLHPFIPFITEEIYQKLAIYPVKCRKAAISPKAKLFNMVKNKKKCLMVETWPV
jgi:valyl-tRNA synthetase